MISSTSNLQVKHLVSLQKKSKIRNLEQVFIVEGYKMISETPIEQIKQLYVSETFLSKNPNIKNKYRIPIEVVTDTVFAYISDTKTPQGILGVVRLLSYDLESLLHSESTPLFLLLDRIQDPGNLGTIFRSAEAAGVTGIILNDGCVDVYNPKVIRSTMGSIYRVPFVIDHLTNVIQTLHEAGITTYATDMENATTYTDCNFKKASAILIGNEGSGLSNELISHAKSRIFIPMSGKVESLNAAMATTVILFEVKRQRGNYADKI